MFGFTSYAAAIEYNVSQTNLIFKIIIITILYANHIDFFDQFELLVVLYFLSKVRLPAITKNAI